MRHMLGAGRKVITFTKDESRASFAANETLQLAIVRLIEIVGEAATRISDEFQAAHQRHAQPPNPRLF